jgi:hypothetical protein
MWQHFLLSHNELLTHLKQRLSVFINGLLMYAMAQQTARIFLCEHLTSLL